MSMPLHDSWNDKDCEEFCNRMSVIAGQVAAEYCPTKELAESYAKIAKQCELYLRCYNKFINQDN